MKKTFLAATTAIIVAGAFSVDANAEERWPRWYLGLTAGASFQPDQDYTISGGGGTGEFPYDAGYSFSAALGYKIPSEDGFLGNSNLELELGFRNNGVDSSDSTAQASTLMENYILNIPTDAGLNPYLGAGVGAAQIDIDATNAAGANGDDVNLMYQFLVGVGFEPETIPNTEFIVGYRYLSAFDDPKVSRTGGGNVEFEYDVHSVEAGFRLLF